MLRRTFLKRLAQTAAAAAASLGLGTPWSPADTSQQRRTPTVVKDHYDLVVVGAGSGGLGAALSAARLGLEVLLVEKAPGLGGTAVRAGVSTWEPTVGATGLPFDIYKGLKAHPQAVGIYSFGRHISWPHPGQPRFPGGEQVIDPARHYADTLQRHIPPRQRADEAYCREHWHGVVFEPGAYCAVVEERLAETERCQVLKNTTFEEVDAAEGRLKALRLTSGQIVRARGFIDATGDGVLALACGAEARLGRDARDDFGEPSAPDQRLAQVNGVTLIYRVTPTDRPGVEPLPDDVPARCWWQGAFPVAQFVHYPNGDLNVNALPLMQGAEFLRLSRQEAYGEARRRALAHWHDLQTRYEEFRGYRLKWLAPMLGVREYTRIMGEYVLREQDVRGGLSHQDHEDIIAIADHCLDTHGPGGASGELSEPYGVPYRCLIPRGFKNLLVACRGASLSSIAASSCRLARTMMQLGQAAGTAAAVAREEGLDFPDVPADALREALRQQHVELQWPRSPAMADYVRQED